jgi:hypothetical protein
MQKQLGRLARVPKGNFEACMLDPCVSEADGSLCPSLCYSFRVSWEHGMSCKEREINV